MTSALIKADVSRREGGRKRQRNQLHLYVTDIPKLSLESVESEGHPTHRVDQVENISTESDAQIRFRSLPAGSSILSSQSPTSVPSPVRPRLLPSIPAAIWPSDLPLIQASTPLPGFSCRICKATLKLGFDEPPEHPWDHNNCYFVSWCLSCIDEALYGLSHQRVDSPPHGMVLHINDILRINAETTDDGGEVDTVLTQISWQRNFNQVVESLLYRMYFVYNGDEKHGGPPYPDDVSKKRMVEPWIDEIGGILCYWRRVEKEGRAH